MPRIEWTTPAADEFERCQAYYQGIDAHAARRLAERVHRAIHLLRGAPDCGRPGLRNGTRELVVPGTPYIVVYRNRGDAVQLLDVFHSRQDWMRRED